MKKNLNEKLTRTLKSPFFKILYIILGTIGVFFLIRTSSASSSDYIVSNLSVVPSLVIFSLFWSKLFNPRQSRRIIFHAVFSLLLSVVFIIGGQLNILSSIIWSWATLIKIFLSCFSFFPILEMLYLLIIKVFKDNTFVLNKKYKLLTFTVVFLSCLIAWLVFLPGIYTYDMAAWNQKLSMGTIISHWSITYGFILAFFLDASNLVFHNYEVGFAIMMLLQAFFISYVLYKIIIYITEESKNKYLLLCTIAFIILTPFIAAMSVTDAQDILFGAFFALAVLELCKFVKQKDYHKNKYHIVKLILFLFIMTTLRNNGIICAGFILLGSLFYKFPAKKALVISSLSAIALYLVYTGPVFQLMNVEKSPTTFREIFGIPSQQVARSYFNNPSSFTDDDIEQLNKFYNTDGSVSSMGYIYTEYPLYPLIADFTKGSFNLNYLNNHIGEYLSFWGKIGIKNKKNYTEAFLLNSLGFWYPIKHHVDPRFKPGYLNYSGVTMTSEVRENFKLVKRVFPKNDITSAADDLIFKGKWYTIPLVSQFCSIGFYTMTILYSLAIIIYRKSYKWLLVMSPVIGFLLTLFVAPVAIYRYAFPIAILMPLFFYTIISLAKSASR